MCLNLVSDSGVVHGGAVISENGGISEDFFKIVDWGWVNGETDGTEPVFKMREEVWYWMFVGDLDKYNLFSQSIIKGVHVDEVDGGTVVVIDFCNLKVAWVSQIGTWSE